MGLVLIVAGLASRSDAGAQNAERPRLSTNQATIEELMRDTALAIDDPLEVFAFVLQGLPERVTVYPTEGYYYFGFTYRGVNYSGNIRLDASDRDQGKVNFGYFEEMADWRGGSPTLYRSLDASQGVNVETLERLVYRVSYRGKSVVFVLNDLSNVKPAPDLLAPHERFIGPIFDESGIRFFLVYNPQIRNFHYVLDETVRVPDQLEPMKGHARVLVGKRTGFAFYRDQRRERKILIGVFEGNARINNHLDGPFDQLPDSYVEGETLRTALIEMDPSLKGKIDRLGSAPGGEYRTMIAPYMHYVVTDDLKSFDRCAARARREAAYYGCFVVAPGESRDSGPSPKPGKR